MKSLTALVLSFALTGFAPAQDDAAPSAIDATDVAALGDAIGKPSFIVGTLASVEEGDKAVPVEIRFEGSELQVFAQAADYWKAGGGWGLPSLIGKQVYVYGTPRQAVAGAPLRMRLAGESSLHDSLESLVASVPKPAAPKPGPGPEGEPEEKKEYEPVSGGAILPREFGAADLAPARNDAAVKVVLPRVVGTATEYVVSEVSAEIMDNEEAGPMQATFELAPKVGINAMIAAMTYLPKKYEGRGWPKNKVAHFVIDEIQADSAPPNFAAAVLIEAMLSGVEIPGNVVLFGGMDASGKLTRSGDRERADLSYSEAIRVAASAARPPVDPAAEGLPKPDKTVYLITGDVGDPTLDDLVIDADWDTLNSVIVLRCTDFESAMTLVREIAEGGEVGETITGLAEAQGVLRERSVRMLTDPNVWARVVAAGKALPGNATAYAYARMRTRKTAETYSLDRCLAHIEQSIDETKGAALDKMSSRDLRKFMRELDARLTSIEAKVHPAAGPVLEAAEDYLGEIGDLTEERIKVGREGTPNERIVEAHNEARAAYQEARQAALAAGAGG